MSKYACTPTICFYRKTNSFLILVRERERLCVCVRESDCVCFLEEIKRSCRKVFELDFSRYRVYLLKKEREKRDNINNFFSLSHKYNHIFESLFLLFCIERDLDYDQIRDAIGVVLKVDSTFLKLWPLNIYKNEMGAEYIRRDVSLSCFNVMLL